MALFIISLFNLNKENFETFFVTLSYPGPVRANLLLGMLWLDKQPPNLDIDRSSNYKNRYIRINSSAVFWKRVALVSTKFALKLLSLCEFFRRGNEIVK